ncbi:MAG: Co2+/Mg2+ efflux protein ApaG [Gammaproteobacteria bacterium]|nr:Co2+/Mg2+ efflux protein ApaG [Gammaproteobacteria bacterium]NNJ72755.1 Co2+/Mg2+ efflux protein ApaG [Enterobacterales bacterium]
MNKIDIDVQTQFIPEQSRPERDLFVFAYTVTIANHGQIPTQLLRRHWVIKDFNQKVMEVQGDGVIGEQPRLMPGESFTYTSGTTLETDVGTMKGSYTMQTDSGEQFDAPIKEFVLSAPQTQVH